MAWTNASREYLNPQCVKRSSRCEVKFVTSTGKR